MNQKLRKIVANFKIEGELVGIEENCQGNINSTYLLTFRVGDSISKYLLQKINSYVFKEPYLVMKNIELVFKEITQVYPSVTDQSYGVHRNRLSRALSLIADRRILDVIWDKLKNK